MRRPKRWDVPFGADMTMDVVARLLTIEPFSKIDPDRFVTPVTLDGVLLNDTRLVRFQPGDVVVRHGDYGASAFLILTGEVGVVAGDGLKVFLGQPEPKRRQWFAGLRRTLLRKRGREVRDEDSLRPAEGVGVRGAGAHVRIFLQDVSAILDRFGAGHLKQGDLFGELAALGRTARAATVFATTEVELLEIRWQGLRELLRRDPQLKCHIDELYRRNALLTHLRATALFSHLTDDELRDVKESVKFERHGDFDWYGSYKRMRGAGASERLADEPLIAEEGTYPDGVILVRSGYIRVSKKHGSGERTVSYLGRGQWYGLDEIAESWGKDEQVPMKRSLRGVGYTDVLRVPTSVVETYVLKRLDAAAIAQLKRVGGDADLSDDDAGAQEAVRLAKSTTLLEFLVENRFINGSAAMVIDLDRCVRCDDCVRACASTHDNNPRFLRRGPKIDHYMVASACMHCYDPVCMIGCPTGAISRDQKEGQVIINEPICIGCGTCAGNCPYENIRMVEVRDRSGKYVLGENQLPIVKATKCDLCADLIAGPSCQRACPHDALVRIDLQEPEKIFNWMDR